MSDADDMALIHKVYAAVSAGDRAGTAALMADDLVITEAAALPYAGRFTGPDALTTLYRIVTAHWEGFEAEFVGMTAGGGTVIAEAVVRGRSRRTGAAFEMPLLELWRVRDGKVAEIRPFYFDTAALAGL